jgi:hypothetical protein
MKHILQSLLLTTVLTLPTAFGSDQMSAFDESTTSAFVTRESNSQVSVKAQLEAQLKKDSFNDILNAAFASELWAKKISNHERNALLDLVYKDPKFTPHQRYVLQGLLSNATPLEIQCAANHLKVLGSKYPEGSNERTKYHTSACTLFKQLTEQEGETSDDMFYKTIGLSSLGSFSPAGSPERADYNDRAAALHEKSAHDQNATLHDILSAADGLKYLGAKYHPKAAELYELAAKHATATLDDILRAADGLKYLVSKYRPKAAELYELAAKDKNANPDDIQSVARGLSLLGSNYHDRAAVFYEKFANHQGTPYSIKLAADGLRGLGSKYPDGSDERTAYNNRANALLSRSPR